MMKKKEIDIIVSEKKKWVGLTGLCNNNCIFCFDGDRTDKSHGDKEEIKNEILKGLEEGATRLVLSGGESTIHPNIIDFIKYGKQQGYKRIQIVTNGRMLSYKSFVKKLADAGLDEVTFSIHGHNKKIHDSMTNLSGSFVQILNGVKNAVGAGFIVNSDTCITKINYKYLPEIINFIHSLGINEVNLMSIVPFGNAWKNKERVIYKFEDVVPYIKKTINFCKEKNIVLWFSRYPAEYLEGYEEYIESFKKLLEDVVVKGEDFFKKIPACYGERCRYCGINTVCSHLISGSYSISTPPCKLATGVSIDKKIIQRGNKSFKDFAEDICRNSRIKKLSCKKCIFNDSCEGVLREEVREKGFGIAKPIINKEIKIQSIEE